MVFASPLFVFAFLPAILLAHAACPARLRNGLLLASSLLFYAWGELDAVSVLVVTTVVNWAITPWLRGRPRLLGAAIAFNLLPLAYFKYSAFLLSIIGIESSPLTLPLGISFYTFQAISYLIDTSRKNLPRGSILDVSLYTTFFPGMVAGPIERYADIQPQLGARKSDGIEEGALLFVRGLAKKLLVANALAVVADDFFALPPSELTTAYAWLAIVCYTMQIYYDFSGYSDMAVGLARMFGFRYPDNFNRPYIARSVTEFWRRWHISLSTWFRDYLYVPLGGNREGAARTYRNLVVVFVLCGLWHGAAWTFVLWGAWHGVWLVVERAGIGKVVARAPAAIANAYALLVVMAGWVFFRADDTSHAAAVFRALAGVSSSTATGPGAVQWVSPHLVMVLGVAVGAALLPPAAGARVAELLERRRTLAVALAIAGFALCALALAARTHNPFIYYRF